jgi:hypothetical protein
MLFKEVVHDFLSSYQTNFTTYLFRIVCSLSIYYPLVLAEFMVIAPFISNIGDLCLPSFFKEPLLGTLIFFSFCFQFYWFLLFIISFSSSFFTLVFC